MEYKQFRYSIRILRDIARCYFEIYDGLFLTDKGRIKDIEMHPFRIAEFKADFDMAFKGLPPQLKEAIRDDINGKYNYLTKEAYREMKKNLNT